MTAIESAQSATLSVADDDSLVIVTLDRPPANALNRRLIEDLAALFADLTARQVPPPVVLTGQGTHFFTAGGDIKELEGTRVDEIDSRMRKFHALLVALDRYPGPVVSAINGHCVGGGVEIALFSDTVLAVRTARFGFPEINHGLLPADKGLQRARAILGVRTTRQMVLSGDLLDARQALDIGLVDELIDDPDALLGAAVARAQSAGAKAPVLYRSLRRSINDWNDARDEESLQRTLGGAAAYFDDPVARRLRERWGSNRKSPPAAAT